MRILSPYARLENDGDYAKIVEDGNAITALRVIPASAQIVLIHPLPEQDIMEGRVILLVLIDGNTDYG